MFILLLLLLRLHFSKWTGLSCSRIAILRGEDHAKQHFLSLLFILSNIFLTLVFSIKNLESSNLAITRHENVYLDVHGEEDDEEGVDEVVDEEILDRLDVGGAGEAGGDPHVDGGQGQEAGDVHVDDHLVPADCGVRGTSDNENISPVLCSQVE